MPANEPRRQGCVARLAGIVAFDAGASMDSESTVRAADPGRVDRPATTAVVAGAMRIPAATVRSIFPGDHACLVTVFTLFRRPVFRDPHAAGAVAAQHARTLPWDRAAWLAWVLMPDHWQGLLACGRDESLPALVGRFKAMTTRAVDPRLRINGWLWGRGHRQAPLDDHGSLGDAARILVSAPRRAGLVACDADYPYWRSAWPVDGQDMAERGGRDA
jgi:hypothetical protein